MNSLIHCLEDPEDTVERRPHQFHLKPLTSHLSPFHVEFGMDSRGQCSMPPRVPHPIVMRELLRRGVGIYGIESKRKGEAARPSLVKATKALIQLSSCALNGLGISLSAL